MNEIRPPASAGNKDKTTADKVKEQIQAFSARHPRTTGVAAAIFWAIAFLGAPVIFFSHITSNTASDTPYAGYPGVEMPSGFSMGTAFAAGSVYFVLALALFWWGVLARKIEFTQKPRNSVKLLSLDNLAYTWATKRFILVTVAFLTIWQSWGQSGLIIFVATVIVFYLFDQRTASMAKAKATVETTELEIANADFVFVIQGKPVIYTHRGLYSEEEVRGRQMPNTWVFVRHTDGLGVDIYVPKPAPTFVPPTGSNVG